MRNPEPSSRSGYPRGEHPRGASTGSGSVQASSSGCWEMGQLTCHLPDSRQGIFPLPPAGDQGQRGCARGPGGDPARPRGAALPARQWGQSGLLQPGECPLPSPASCSGLGPAPPPAMSLTSADVWMGGRVRPFKDDYHYLCNCRLRKKERSSAQTRGPLEWCPSGAVSKSFSTQVGGALSILFPDLAPY